MSAQPYRLNPQSETQVIPGGGWREGGIGLDFVSDLAGNASEWPCARLSYCGREGDVTAQTLFAHAATALQHFALAAVVASGYVDEVANAPASPHPPCELACSASLRDPYCARTRTRPRRYARPLALRHATNCSIRANGIPPTRLTPSCSTRDIIPLPLPPWLSPAASAATMPSPTSSLAPYA